MAQVQHCAVHGVHDLVLLSDPFSDAQIDT
jgi:hypothetical protein